MARALVLLFLASAGCASTRPTGLDALAAARGHELALRAVRAHGGLSRWATVGGVALRVHAGGLFDTGALYPVDGEYLLDPARNRALVRFATRAGRVEWRYDGHQASILRDGRCDAREISRKKAAGLLTNLLFWFGVPFKFLDAGAHVADAGGRLYVTYDVGETPDDWYLASFDADGRVAQITYVATAVSRRLEFSTRWSGNHTVDGFTIATHREFRPRSHVLRGLARPAVLDFAEIRLHQPLDDAWFRPCQENAG
jgi:hypothetical protein